MAVQDATSEATPLLSSSPPPKKWGKAVTYKLLFCSFLISLSFAVTQVPLVWVFHVFTCQSYYESHPDPSPSIDRCSNREIEAATARAVSLLGTSTTFFGVLNLFLTTWSIKRFGVKSALLIQVFFPAVRLLIQNFGVAIGSSKGIMIIQLSQIITILGGPAGYLLALNNFVAEVIEHRERTGALGRLQGCQMIGLSGGYLVGGLVSDSFGDAAPFKLTLGLFVTSCVYVLLFLPWVPPNKDVVTPASRGIVRFFGPLKTFAPITWRLPNGSLSTQYGTLFLGIGVFLGVLATGYIPVLLQLYSTDILHFGTRENGFLISLNSLIRGLFLTFAFPKIISFGRAHFTHSATPHPKADAAIPELPTEQGDFAANDGEPIEPPKMSSETETFEFDLLFTKYSLVVDGILTGMATFVTEGWQIYVVAVLLPLASGTGSSAKGTILQMCPPSERADALSAITLLEMIARLSTVTIFGVVFAAFAEIGKTHLVFTCNAAIAFLGFVVLLFSRFPPAGSERYTEEIVEDTSE